MSRPCFIIALFFLFFSQACKKDQHESQLPAETQEGKNTFVCLVDGKVWLPRGDFSRKGADLSYDPTFNGGTLSIKAQYWYYQDKDMKVSTKEYISLSLGELSKPGTYSLVATDQQGLADYSMATDYGDKPPYLSGCEFDAHEHTKKGILTITKIDLDKGFISGRFEFTQTRADASSKCPNTINVTQGRFDLKL